MENITAIGVISLLATIASFVLAVVAILLSVFFYRMSTELSEKTREAAKGIGASVDRLEKLFDKLYADTFSMVKDTVSDMRKHIWPETGEEGINVSEEVERKTEERLAALRIEYREGIDRLLDEQRVTGDRVTSLRSELEEMVSKAIAESRQIQSEVKEEAMRDRILKGMRRLQSRYDTVTSGLLFDELGVSANDYLSEINKLVSDSLIELDGGPERTKTVVRLVPGNRKRRKTAQQKDSGDA